MTTKIKNACFLIAMLLLTLSLIQGCGDDNADPVATHVKVKAVYGSCNSITLQILNPRYAAMGQKDYACWDNNCMSAVCVDQLSNTAYYGRLKGGEEYYVDMKRIQPQPFQPLCDIAPAPPDVAVAILKIY